MANKNLQEFKATHSGGDVVVGAEVMEPVTGAGGKVKMRLGDKKDAAYPVPKVGEVSGVKTPGNVTETFDSLFEDMELSEDFKDKLSLVFEAAVNEATSMKTAEIAESLEEEFETKLEEAVTETMEDIVENLDNYLDYVVKEWMEENKLAIETNLKVEMAESFMDGLKSLFTEHNIDLDESKLNVVADLEEQLADARQSANKAINESIELAEQVRQLEAEQIFNGLAEGLTTSQAERLRILSEKLDISDLGVFEKDLGTLKESFFKTKTPYITEEVELEELAEIPTSKPKYSADHGMNALAAAISAIKR